MKMAGRDKKLFKPSEVIFNSGESPCWYSKNGKLHIVLSKGNEDDIKCVSHEITESSIYLTFVKINETKCALCERDCEFLIPYKEPWGKDYDKIPACHFLTILGNQTRIRNFKNSKRLYEIIISGEYENV